MSAMLFNFYSNRNDVFWLLTLFGTGQSFHALSVPFRPAIHECFFLAGVYVRMVSYVLQNPLYLPLHFVH